MQEELGWTRSSLRKCMRPLLENGLRAHDDDPRVPVLNNRHGCEKPCYDAGFSGTSFDCVFVLPNLLQRSETSVGWISRKKSRLRSRRNFSLDILFYRTR